MIRLRQGFGGRGQRESARALLREMDVEAVRVAYDQGVDVWAVYCGRRADPVRWEQVKRAATVMAAMALTRRSVELLLEAAEEARDLDAELLGREAGFAAGGAVTDARVVRVGEASPEVIVREGAAS